MKPSLRRVVDWCGGSAAALREKKIIKTERKKKSIDASVMVWLKTSMISFQDVTH